MRKYRSKKARWEAIRTRDPDANGYFYYGVKSTGIYCRPSCPSRLPKQGNVEYFSDPSRAQQAGYRACKRCRPDRPTVNSGIELARRVCAIIDAQPDKRLTLHELAAQAHSSPFHLQRSFKQVLGLSPRQYQEQQCLNRFKQALQHGSSVTTAVYNSGFGSSSRVYAKMQQLGMSPSVYRHGGKNMQISYSIMDTTFGKLLVAATSQGICRVDFGDNINTLTKSLRREFPNANLQQDSIGLNRYTGQIQAYLQGKRKLLRLPLHIAATAFQHAVWDVLSRIPYAETRSYSDIALAIGAPKSVRAVAGACARNPVALLIPCHRVVHKNGKLSGYRWGIKRKASLLRHECGED
ncbi:MAG TPA: bifunctional DNA-binding transcriptional regulator/O6-methylguanine-DNA methyltransferase Ada [Gammaproteobacteria bacterium]